MKENNLITIIINNIKQNYHNQGFTVVTGTTGGRGTSTGAWKKYNMNPAASRKWNANIDPTRIKKYLDFLRAGSSQNIRTAPETKAAIRTNIH